MSNTAESNGPEYRNALAFVEYLIDDERTTFTIAEVQRVAANTRQTHKELIAEIAGWGFAFTAPAAPKAVRGFTANNHNRFEGNPGSGGSGWQCIAGFAGQEG